MKNIFKKLQFFPPLIRCKLTFSYHKWTNLFHQWEKHEYCFDFRVARSIKNIHLQGLFFFLQFLFIQGLKYILILQNSGTYSWNSLHTDGIFWVAAGSESVLCSRAPVWMKRTVPVNRVRLLITLSLYDLGDVRISWSFFFILHPVSCMLAIPHTQVQGISFIWWFYITIYWKRKRNIQIYSINLSLNTFCGSTEHFTFHYGTKAIQHLKSLTFFFFFFTILLFFSVYFCLLT